MECALTLTAAQADNVSAATAATFSRKWNKLVRKYCEIIKAKLQESSMEDIILKACPYMKSGTNITCSGVLSNDVDDDIMEDLNMFVDL